MIRSIVAVKDFLGWHSTRNMMSLCNVGSMAGAWVGGKIFDYFGVVKYVNGEVVYQEPGQGFTWMVIISSAMGLIPLVFLRLLKEFKTNEVQDT